MGLYINIGNEGFRRARNSEYIDKWDAICREFSPGTKEMDAYVDWLRRKFKSASASTVFAVVYMTGFLPVKKYKTESALNNFTEYSMVDPHRMARFFGFTKDEVRALASKHEMDFNDLVLIPRKHTDSPAIVIELKYDKDADTAISQIKRKDYPAEVAQYTDNLMLVGINYDREKKQHKCHIEKFSTND